MNRENWKSHIGFILAASGSAIGLGNIWRFPYTAGENGGGVFVLLYIGCVALVGLPVMLCEFVLGRKTEKNPVGAYSAVSGGHRYWKIPGFMGVLSGFLILSFYSVVGGWTLAYVLKGLSGEFAGYSDPSVASSSFVAFVQHPVWPIYFHGIFIAMCVAIVFIGVRKGIERCCHILMRALFVLLLIIIVRSLTLPNAWEGVAFFLRPDFSKITANTFLVALGQAFFSLSLGMGAMITYGSYVSKGENLWSASVTIVILDTLVALLAGFAIFPAIFSFGFDPAAGPGLVFTVLPAVFAKLPGGAHVWGTLFFLLLSIAALTSGISLLEVVTAYYVDEKGYDRRKVSVLAGLVIFLIGIPCALSMDSSVQFNIFGLSLFDALEGLTSNILLPLGGLLICIFVGWKWGIRQAVQEISSGAPLFAKAFHSQVWGFLVRYVAPVAVALVFLSSIGVLK